MTSREQLAAENGMSVEYVNWFFDHKKDGCGNVWFVMMAAMWEGWQAASKASEQQLAAVVAENVGLKEQAEEVYAAGYNHGHLNTVDGIAYADCVKDDFYGLAMELIREAETPATDAYLAEVRAQAIRDALDVSSDYLDTDCVMDRLDISYEDAELRTSGAIDLHDALVAVAKESRKGTAQ